MWPGRSSGVLCGSFACCVVVCGFLRVVVVLLTHQVPASLLRVAVEKQGSTSCVESEGKGLCCLWLLTGCCAVRPWCGCVRGMHAQDSGAGFVGARASAACAGGAVHRGTTAGGVGWSPGCWLVGWAWLLACVVMAASELSFCGSLRNR